LLVVNAQVEARDIRDFVELVKKSPNKLRYGDSGAGGNQHLCNELFKQQASVEIQPVHYRGAAAMMPELLANQVQMSSNMISMVEPHIASGKLRPLLVMGAKRDPKFPDVPTAREAGLNELESCTTWFGLHAPKGTPTAVLDSLRAAVAAFLADKDVVSKLSSYGVRPVGSSQADFVKRIATDHETFGRAAREANVTIE
jgi:tripartite-type tricarboxylate transporter receptor subunit TctC